MKKSSTNKGFEPGHRVLSLIFQGDYFQDNHFLFPPSGVSSKANFPMPMDDLGSYSSLFLSCLHAS